MTARLLLDLAELFDSPAALTLRLASRLDTTVDDLLNVTMPSSDRTTRRTAASLLRELGAVDEKGNLIPPGASAAAAFLDLALDVRSEVLARQPVPTSALAVTATSSRQLAAVRVALHLRPLFQLIEDVVRATAARCVLGAPYWNAAALDRLRPSLMGLARRAGEVQFICQGADPNDTFNPVGILGQFCRDLLGEGARTAEVWAFDVRDDTGHRALIHAKFAIADARLGYLGSANMTGQGFAEHFEIGVRLSKLEAADLASLVSKLRAGSFLQRVA